MSTATEAFQTTLRHVEQAWAWKGPGEDVFLMIVGTLPIQALCPVQQNPPQRGEAVYVICYGCQFPSI